MSKQIPIDPSAIVDLPHNDDGTHQIRGDVAYRRQAMVNVVFYGLPGSGDRQWLLIDTGVSGMSGLIISAAAQRFGEGSRPAAIVLTHGHADHVGSAEKLAELWDVPVYAHRLELPYLNGTASYPPADARVGGGLMPVLSKLFSRGPIQLGKRLFTLPDDGAIPHMEGWRWLHTPGHTPGHVSLWRETDRTLIVGDAFITTNQESAYAVATQAPEIHGPPTYFTPDWEAAARSVETLVQLQPQLVVTGHGRAMQGPEMLAAVERLAREFMTIATPPKSIYLEHPARAEDGSAYCKP